MLQSLHIRNYALIENLDIEWCEGLTVITGQTGAGKSIILGALGLLLGDRADVKALSDKGSKCIVEGKFGPVSEELESILEAEELDDSDIVIVRREILPSGRSRAFVNDTPVKVETLKEIGKYLIEIHSQHDTRALMEADEHLNLLDAYARNAELRENYGTIFQGFAEEHRELKLLKNDIQDLKKAQLADNENLAYLEQLKPVGGELAELETELELLSDAATLKETLSSIYGDLEGAETNAVSLIEHSLAKMENLPVSLFAEQEPERLKTLSVELRDLTRSLRGISQEIDANPVKLERTEERIRELRTALKRFRLGDDFELANLRDLLKARNTGVGELMERMHSLERNLKAKGDTLKEEAAAITETRQTSAEELEKAVMEKAHALGLPNLKFKVQISERKLNSKGKDDVRFMTSFNVNQPLMPIETTASGGEMARLMLALKGALAKKVATPTIIFDEIDTGVSGEIAAKMGKQMEQLADDIQVIAITHLPQVAALGKTHLYVVKNDLAERSVTNIAVLNNNERVAHLAEMLSSEEVNDAAIENAKILLTQSRDDK